MTVQEFDINSVDFDDLNLIENTPNIGNVMWLNTKRIDAGIYVFREAKLSVPRYMINRITGEESVYKNHGYGVPFRYDNPDVSIECANLVVNNVCNCGLSDVARIRCRCVDNCRRSEAKQEELEGDDMNLTIKENR